MNTSSDIWFAFIRTFSMLFLVLAVLIFAFYLIRKFSTAKGVKGSKDFIKVLSVHHLSPKEKLVLVDVLGDKILIGVTPSHISKIASPDKEIEISSQEDGPSFNFSDFLSQKLGSATQKTGSDKSGIAK